MPYSRLRSDIMPVYSVEEEVVDGLHYVGFHYSCPGRPDRYFHRPFDPGDESQSGERGC